MPTAAALTLVDYTPCGGATPRNIALSPSGRLLFSANQNADRISIFARDAATGRLTDTGKAIPIGTPMCVRVVVRADRPRTSATARQVRALLPKTSAQCPRGRGGCGGAPARR